MDAKKETVLSVSGMTCGSCARHVQVALKDVEGVTDVVVQLREGRVLVRSREDGPSVDAMIEALQEAGYASQIAR